MPKALHRERFGSPSPTSMILIPFGKVLPSVAPEGAEAVAALGAAGPSDPRPPGSAAPPGAHSKWLLVP